MSLFINYIQPLLDWVQENPSWSLFITFLISLAESLAIIGSIVPGSVTMTAIGILAGSGVLRVDLTLIAAILGAIAGDSISYFLGYYYSDRLYERWPFRKYPSLLYYGKQYVEKHGGKSVLIGRFIGPLRSIIPLIAGMLHMKQWRFFIANTLSAVGWSFLYVMPGVVIGAASHELTPESATHFFIIILIGLAGIWLLSQMLKWILIRLNSFFKNQLHQLWLALQCRPLFYRICTAVTPIDEENHYKTALLSLIACVSLMLFITLVFFTATSYASLINKPVYFFINSLHTTLLMTFFILFTPLTNSLTLFVLYLACFIWWLLIKHDKAIIYLTSVIGISFCTGVLLNYSLDNLFDVSFSATQLMIATSFYTFLLLFNHKKQITLTNRIKIVLIIALGLNGLGFLYLGDYFLSDLASAYLAGTTIGFCHFLRYRKTMTGITELPGMMMLLLLSLMIATSFLSICLNFKVLANQYTPPINKLTLKESEWWNQQKPMLPLYRLGRLGKKANLINLQYDGDLDSLKNNLLAEGWTLHSGAFLTNLLLKMNNKPDAIKIPLFAQLYQSKPPKLIMTYKLKMNSSLIFIITIWESNYSLKERNKPLWLGTLSLNTSTKSLSSNQQVHLIAYVLAAFKKYKIKQIKLPTQAINPINHQDAPYILLIKE